MTRTADFSESEFALPPRDCAQIPFWFLNGSVNGEEYARQVSEMNAKSVHQVMPHPRFGMDRRDYLTDRYWRAFDHLIEQAERDDVVVHLYDEFNWSSGPAGGRVTSDVSCCALGLGMKSVAVEGPGIAHLAGWTDGLKGWGRREGFVAAFRAPQRGENLPDLTKLAALAPPSSDTEVIHLDVPAGAWVVMVFYTIRTIHPSPLRMGNGGVIDYLAVEPTRRFIEVTHEQYAKRYGHLFGTRIQSVFYDECGPYASGPFTWTADFLEQFRARAGYELQALLPLLFYDGHPLAEKTRCDYWDTVAHLYSERFVGQLADWCERHHLALTGHSYEESRSWMVAADLFRSLRRQQWVGLDALNGPVPFAWLKTAVSVAHVTGRREVVCEAFGLLGLWACSPRMIRKACNRLAIAGVTHLVPHAFFQTIDNPKVECPPSFFEHNPYWKYYDLIAATTARQCWLNRQGRHVADVAVFYPLVSWWGDSTGGRGAGFPWATESWKEAPCRPDCENFDAIIDTLMASQIDLDVIDGQALQDAVLDDGTIRISDEAYRVLVLPPMRTIRLVDLVRVADFAERGGRVIVVGRWPDVSMEQGRNDLGLSSEVGRLRRQAKFVLSHDMVCDCVRDWIEPDVQLLSGNAAHVEVSHRIVGDRHLYLICNTAETPKTFVLSVRAVGRTRRLDVESGMSVLMRSRVELGRTIFDLTLNGDELTCVCLTENEQPLALDAQVTSSRHISMEGNWTFLPMASDVADPFAAWQVIEIPVFRTRAADHEPAGEPFPWDSWFTPAFDDSDWPTAHCRRNGLLFDDRSSHCFRAWLPAGASALSTPLPVAGEYALYINGRLERVELDHASTTADWLPIAKDPGSTLVAIECASMAPGFGITGPLQLRCVPYQTPLRSWTELGLAWFSGRCVYQKSFSLEETAGHRIHVDLGDVRECAEVWINGQPVGTRLWPPYRLDITEWVRRGKNELAVVVSNLLSNQFAWDVLGSRGVGKTLPSGLLGPVRIELQQIAVSEIS